MIEKFEALDIENAEHMETSAPGGAALSSETRQGRSEKRVFPRKRVRSSAKQSWKMKPGILQPRIEGLAAGFVPGCGFGVLQEPNRCVCSVCVNFPPLLPWPREIAVENQAVSSFFIIQRETSDLAWQDTSG